MEKSYCWSQCLSCRNVGASVYLVGASVYLVGASVYLSLVIIVSPQVPCLGFGLLDFGLGLDNIGIVHLIH